MSSTLLNKAGKSLFEKHLAQYAPTDPLYEEYITDTGKKKRRKRALPPGLSARDAKILKSVQRRAHYLDKGFNLCGIRFGWTFIIGIIPMAGDATDAALNYFLVVRKARKAELPDWLLHRMLMNNAASVMMGLVPLAGDVMLAAFKANSRNAALLEEFLRIRGDEFIKQKAKQDAGGSSAAGKQQPLPIKDAEQIKPGAGADSKVGDEKVDEVIGTMPPSTAQKKKGSILSWRPSVASTKGKGREDTLSVPTTPAAARQQSDRGKFVEDVGSVSNSPVESRNGTFRKTTNNGK